MGAVSELIANANMTSIEKRPRMRLSDRRARQLIDASMDEFLSKGFRHGSIENIARATGVGKATIYRHFTDKNGLFHAAVEAEIEQLETPPYDFETATASGQVQVLDDFARRSLELFCRERSLTLHRTIIEAGNVFPGLARAVHDRLTLWSIAPLKVYLSRLAAQGEIEIEDVDWAAHQFVNLATHGMLFLMTPPPNDAQARQILARETVALFLGGASSMQPPPVLGRA